MRPRRIAWLALLLAGTLQAQLAPEQRRSDFEALSPDLQAMQRDDTRNPAMLWVQQGAQLWQQPAGTQQRSCAGCHGEVQSLRGVAARYPAFDAPRGGALNLAQRINRCRTQQQQAAPWPLDSEELLALEALVALQSRGLPLAPPDDARLQPVRELGRQLYVQRMGQLNLSCAQCHDQRWGQRLGGTRIPQAHPNSYPQYRLEWQGLGSLQRRLRNCMSGVRAQPWPLGAPELVALELYLADRSHGLPMESPGVRP
ncbi:MAG: sulfur oxidation c-type cytochrome SoxA [Hylemonella sp.]|uniref:sulfur oxidation c-type cytochrome SoxA n=1 Tax=Hylemonella sp. TaxID=2066020 RepID=UPI0022CBD2E1|nr:sulfur oxidation c-type cytochrome SoxA [Hylemonella sp.]MCZ8253160.1 sulfur oxidation c-type cytochrome SoxA [Hylemonella sp.]